MNNKEINKAKESSNRRLIAVIILLLAQLFKNIDWEQLEFIDCTHRVTHEQSVNYTRIKQIKKPRQSKLTFVTLKQYKGFENVNEEDAKKDIEFIQRMAKVLYYLNIDEQKTNS